MINSADLRVFHAVVENKSMVAASRRLNVTPSSITQRIKQLENKMEVKLINRGVKGVELTEEGELFYSQVDKIISSIEHLEELFIENRKEIRGTLKVLAPLGFGTLHVADIIGEFSKIHPQLKIDLELSDDPNWSESHKWDMIIHIGELRDSSLKLVKLASNKRFICASPKYLDINGAPQTPKQLLDHSCIALRENSEDVTLWRFSKDGVEESIRVADKLSSNEGGVVKKWALSDLGVILRSEWDIKAEIKQGWLVQLLPDYKLPDADIVALLGTDINTRQAKTNAFLNYLKQEIPRRLS